MNYCHVTYKLTTAVNEQLTYILFVYLCVMHYIKGVPSAESSRSVRVWGRVLVANLTLTCAMRGDRDSNPGPSGHRRETFVLCTTYLAEKMRT